MPRAVVHHPPVIGGAVGAEAAEARTGVVSEGAEILEAEEQAATGKSL